MHLRVNAVCSYTRTAISWFATLCYNLKLQCSIFFLFLFFSSAFWIGFCWNCMECQTTFQALMPGPCNERWGWRIKSHCCWSTGFVRACEKKQRWKLWSTRSRYSLISGALLTSLGWVQCFMVFGWWRKLAAGCSFWEGRRKHGVRNGTLPRFSPVV